MAAAVPSIPDRPAPWTCKSETYWLFFNTTGPLPADAYHPLEAAHSAFADPAQSGAFKGGLGTVQFVRYSDSPAGPYDELLISPGAFEVPKSIPGGKVSRKTSRVTRIYVSQRETLYNGMFGSRSPVTIPPLHTNTNTFIHRKSRKGMVDLMRLK